MTSLKLTLACAAIAAALLCACSTNSPVQQPDQAALEKHKTVRIILVGDSTMASHSGYGDALCQHFKPEVICLNLAKGGRSSGSYRAEASWDVVMTLLKNSRQFAATLVLIQFGHNDQPGKPGRSTDLQTEYPVNMARYVDDVQAAGARPILVTALTRRSFKGADLQNDLRPWAEASMAVARNKQISFIDLNAISYQAVQAMGQAEADTLAMAPAPAVQSAATSEPAKTEKNTSPKNAFDRTHLGSKGARYFSSMLMGELLKVAPELREKVNEEFRP